MKNAFDELSRLDMAEKESSELEDMSIETSKMEKCREQGLEKKNNVISKDCGTTAKGITYIYI